ncbi:MAG TPA: PH domain-containing protein [Steroidobacteraceae bacterium]|nr:PH domain-containing protein [Steroidobacteraceae bacterium]
MSYITSTLIPGETVVYRTRLHWTVMFGHLLLGCVFLAAAGALAYFYWLNRSTYGVNTQHLLEGGVAALFLIGFITILIGMARRNATEMAVTNRRVIVKQGLASRRTIEMLLSKIETIEVTESTGGRMLGYGTILLIGTGGTSEPFNRIGHPLEFRSQVLQQLEKLPSQRGITPEGVDAAPAATRAGPTKEISDRAV